MASKQIKHILIKTETQGAKAAEKQIDALKTAINEAAEDLKTFGGISKSFTKSMTKLGGLASRISPLATSLESVAASAKSLNTSVSGTADRTKKVESYIINLEVLGSVLQDLAGHASRADAALDGVNASSGMRSLLEVLESIEYQTRKTKQYIADLGVSTDRTTEEIEQLGYSLTKTGKAMGKTGKGAEKLAQDHYKLAGGTRASAKSFSQLAFGANPLVNAYAAIAVNVYAVGQAFRLLSEAAAFTRLQDQTAKFSSAISGINVKRLAQEMQGASAGALTLKDSLKFATKGAAFNFGAEELERLTVGARKASIALGIDFSDAMDRVLRGISKQEIELFDELGVVTRLTTAFKNYGEKVNRTVESLTDYERQVALTEEVQRQLDERFSGIDLDTTGWEKLGVAVSDFSTRTLGTLASKLESTADSMANLLDALSSPATAAEAAAESMETFEESMKVGNVIQAGVALQEYERIVRSVSEANIEALGPESDARKEREKKVDSVTSLIRVMGALTAATLLYFKTAIVGSVTTALVSGYMAVGKAVVGLIAVTRALTTAALPNVLIGMTALVTPIVTSAGALLGWSGAATIATTTTTAMTGSLIAARVAALALVAVPIVAALSAIIYGASWLAEKLVEPLTDASIEARNASEELAKMRKELELGGYAMGKGFDPKQALAWTKGLAESQTIIAKIKNEAKEVVHPLEAAALEFEKMGSTPTGLGAQTQKMKDLQVTFQNFVDDGTIPAGTESFHAFAAELRNAAEASKYFNEEFQTDLNIKSIELAGQATKELTLTNMELSAVQEELNRHAGAAGSLLGDEEERSLKALEKTLIAKKKAIELEKERKTARDSMDLAHNLALDNLRLETSEQSKILQLQIEQLRAKAALNPGSTESQALLLQAQQLENKLIIQDKIDKKQRILNGLTEQAMALELSKAAAQSNEALAAIELQQHALEIKQAQAMPEDEERRHALAMLAFEGQKLEAARKAAIAKDEMLILDREQVELQRKLDQAGSAKSRVAERQLLLDVERDRIALMTDEIAKKQALALLELDQDALNQDAKAAPFEDAASTFSSMAALPGITELQGAGLGLAESFSTVFADASKAGMEGFSGFTEFLSGNLESFTAFSQGVANAATTAFQASSDAKVASIDNEIAAEKKRDGKSKESLAKIKALEIKKIKEQSKAKKASVVMSTAAAIAQTFADLGWPAGIPGAAMMAGMGVMQIANINKAASGQMAALDTGVGSSGMKVEGGSRKNDVDVARNANAGELAYINNLGGRGTANSFNTPGRAGGGSSGAGASIMVGERGPEEITPLVPVAVAPTDSKSGGSSLVFSPVFNVESLDSSGFEAVTERFSVELFNSLERELQARNMTLNNLA